MVLLETSTLTSVLYGVLGVGACLIGIGLPIWLVVWIVLRYRKNLVTKQVPGNAVSPDIPRSTDRFDMASSRSSTPAPIARDPLTDDAKSDSDSEREQTDEWGSIFDDPAEQPQWGFDETEWSDPDDKHDERPGSMGHP